VTCQNQDHTVQDRETTGGTLIYTHLQGELGHTRLGQTLAHHTKCKYSGRPQQDHLQSHSTISKTL